MGTDARGHTAPLPSETPRRQVLNDLSMTVNDIVPVPDATTRTNLPGVLSAAGYPVTAAKPLWVWQQDADQVWRYNGTSWRNFSAWKHNILDATNTAVPAASTPLITTQSVATACLNDGSGNGYYDITFPTTFLSPPIVTATTKSGSQVGVVLGTIPTTTGVRLFWPGQAGVTIGAYVVAIGYV